VQEERTKQVQVMLHVPIVMLMDAKMPLLLLQELARPDITLLTVV
jgi:hypothetical protein